jgi:hypothetical protein
MRNVAIVIGVFIAVTDVHAGQLQSIADAARKSEEVKKTAPPATYGVKDLVGDVEWIITQEGLDEYAKARLDIAALRRKTLPMNTRLFEASRRATRLAELAPALSAEPPIVETLSKHGMNSKEYLRREQALLNATTFAAQKQLPDTLKKRPIRMQNIDFVKSNNQLVKDTTARYQKAEGGSPPWFNPQRFVEQP